MTSGPEPVGTLEVALAHAEKLLLSQPGLAAEQAREILGAVPNHPAATLLLAMARRRSNDVADALRILEPLAASQPRWAATQRELGLALGDAGRGEEAVVALRTAVRLLDKVLDVTLWPLPQQHAEAALAINPNYGRGYIALGNLQFDRGDLFGARQTYLTAATLPNQPPEALVAIKAAQGLGNVHLRQLIGVHPTAGPGLDEVRRLADAGLAHYSAVIAAAGPDPEMPLRDLAARATFYRGEIHQLCAEVKAAALDYAAALEFDPGPPLANDIATMQATLPRQEE